MFKTIFKKFFPEKPKLVYNNWSLEYIISDDNYQIIKIFISSLGISKLDDHVWLDNINYSGFTSHDFYYSLHIKCCLEKMNIITKFIKEIPKLYQIDEQYNSVQSDKCLIAGAKCKSLLY